VVIRPQIGLGKAGEVDVRHIFGAGLLLAFLINVATSTATRAMTCTDREQVCFAYCDKNNPGPRCKPVCQELLSKCMSTGCWESKITAKRCGIDRQ
jgi:hypothetical protein